MSFSQFVAILFARWRWFVSIFVGVIFVALLLGLLLPKRYTATATVVLDSKPDPVAALTAMVSPNATTAYMATQVDILSSDRVALRVVRNLRMAENTKLHTEWEEQTGGAGSIEGWLAESLSNNLRVKPGRESNLISVSYEDTDAGRAANNANAFVQAYMDTILELKVNPAKQYSSFFDDQSKQARDALEKAQKKLSDYQHEKGMTSNDERLDVENARLNDLSTQLVSIQGVRSDAVNRQIQAEQSVESGQEVLNNQVIGALKSDLSRAQAHLQELNSRLGDNNPQIIELKSNIGELKSRIALETNRVTGGMGLVTKISEAREADVRAALEAQRIKVLGLKHDRDQLMILANDVDNAQKAYDALIARLNQTSLESADRLPNVSVLNVAEPPAHPSSPRVLLNVVIAFFVGLFLAIIVTMLVEHFDRRVRVIDDIHFYLGEPVVGILPSPDASAGMFTKEPITLLQQRLLRHAKA